MIRYTFLLMYPMLAKAQTSDTSIAFIKFQVSKFISTSHPDQPIVQYDNYWLGKKAAFYITDANHKYEAPPNQILKTPEDSIRAKRIEEAVMLSLKSQPATYGYSNYVTQKSYYHRSTPRKVYYCITDTLEGNVWTLLNDTTRVLNKLCYKAISKLQDRTFTAWYTKEIPISGGPKFFKGLPGFILKTEDTKGLYNCEAIVLEIPSKTSKVIEQKCPDSNVITLQEFSKIFLGEQNAMMEAIKSQAKPKQ